MKQQPIIYIMCSRSAANRKHAPALYNLGLCYEIGIGVSVDEKAVSTSFDLYKYVSNHCLPLN